MVTLTIPYIIPLYLGMTWNAWSSRPGVDIFDLDCVKDPVVTTYKQTKSTYKIVNSLSDVKDMLDVSGDLSLKVKAGEINIAGKGSFIKDAAVKINEVHILTTLQYRAAVKSFKQDCKPRDNWWNSYNVKVLGTHYVSSITYGAEMVASLRFVVFNTSDVKEIKGEVNAALGSGGSGIDLVAEGKLETLQKKVEGKANLEISYYGTVPLNSIPNDITGFRKLTTTFKEQIEEAKLEDGIPMEVELSSLEDIADDENRDKFTYLKNKDTEDKISDFEGMMDELRNCRVQLTGWAKALPYHIKDEHEKEVGRLLRNITLCLEVFYDVCWKLNISEGPQQLQPAFDAYDYDGGSVFNRYHKLVTRLIQRLNPLIKREEVPADTYFQYGNNNCTAYNTQVLYEGFVISSPPEGIGGMAQYDCAPSSPKKGYELSDDKLKSHVAGKRYPKLDKNNPFEGENAKKISEKGMPCAKCYSPDSSSVVMFSATKSCPLTWEEMYTGYLMSSKVGDHTTQYICVDDTPSAGYKMDASSKDILALTVVHTDGSLPKETYINDALIRCVVCAMKSNQISF